MQIGVRPAEDSARLDAIARLSREIALACDTSGTITWADARAERALGPCVGRHLAELAAPGTEGKVAAFLARGGGAAELCVLVSGAPTTLVLRGTPEGDLRLLVGSLVPQDYTDQLARASDSLSAIAELQRQAERSRHELAEEHGRLTRAYADLEDSNRGLVSLHAEIDEKNASLGRATAVKTRVVAHVSHEFRTPINSILGITQLLLDRLDGELTPEQEKQLRFVRTSAEALSELVNDLLDLSRLEAGHHQLRIAPFSAAALLGSLRGMMKPLFRDRGVELVVHEPEDLPPLTTDEGRVAQILRNLVSNALKFTAKGTVTVGVQRAEPGFVSFFVEDTGIGIAREDQGRIFEEFTQIDSELQRQAQGTGLGLSLSRRLAELLGGTLVVRSAPGRGSRFTLTIPEVHEEEQEMRAIHERAQVLDPVRAKVLVIEDDRQTLFLYERYLTASGFQVLAARTLDDARRIVERVVPAAVVLDVMLEGESTWRFLRELKESERTRAVPVMVVTVVDTSQRARALGADEFWLKPIDADRLIRKVSELAKRSGPTRVLVIDDDEASRYVMRRLLEPAGYDVLETGDGAEGVALARSHQPQLILLDFVLGGITAFDVIDDLKIDSRTRNIPVIIQTAKELDHAERERLARETKAILQKQNLSRELAIARIREALHAAGVPATAVTTEPLHGK